MQRAIRYASALAVLCALGAFIAPANAGTPWVFKHDEFPASLSGAVAGVSGGSYYVQPGFVEGEAFGQVYSPTPEMYPIDITGFDFVLAAPPYGTPGTDYSTRAWIEIYNSTSNTADPGGAPLFSISTDDLMNQSNGSIGVPLVGNTAFTVKFDTSDPANHPAPITQGKIWLVIRYAQAARDLSTDWGTLACMAADLGELGELCGCQSVATAHDNDGIVKKANVMNIVTPIGTCSGSKSWVFMEDIDALPSGFTIDGDLILRLKADVADAPCVPACDGLECGSDGCGGTCGPCGADERCHEGQCVLCVADCNGKECGDNGCGGTCGNCKTDEVCSASQCEPQCTPSCAGRDCGNNGCGGICGSCESDEQCVNGAREQACVPACSGRDCGDDSCGGSCGSCTGGKTCNAGGFCVAAACAPSCSGRNCGDDGCGGSCGTCAVGVCSNGTCGPDCEPVCDGKSCGNDGCGGSCGTCEGGETCSTAGACVAAEGTFEVLDISPDFGTAGAPVAVSITGHGFVSGASAKLGAVALTEVVVTGSSLLSATVPGTLAPGKYTVIVVNPDGDIAQKIDGFEVRSAITGNGSSGCETGGAGTGLGFAMMAVAGAMWAQRRRGN